MKDTGARVVHGGAEFAVWAPNAHAVLVAGDFTGWRPEDDRPLSRDPGTGYWSGFVAGAASGQRYKYRIHGADGHWRLMADPAARHSEVPPKDASVLYGSTHQWSDERWIAARRTGVPHRRRALACYEVHLPSWRPGLDYRELARDLVPYVADLGFTHVELLPVMEHPYGGSWGYQTTGYYAPTARLGDPDGLRVLVDAFHRAGIGVILDWVPAHFPRDEWALARFDGGPLYEHPDPRRGEHPDWGSLVFDFGRPEVRDFLVGSALYWIEEFHADGLRVDAVSSMLYLDYSRGPGGWEPNIHGGTANLEAVDFLRTLTTQLRQRHPDVVLVAEESAIWPGVSHPVEDGGLGFDIKWNLGWMHDTLDYLARDPVHRHWHHDDVGRPSTYAFTENWLLPLSHDEVVHGKRSLAAKLPGDRHRQLAGLRGLYAYQWAFPGKKLVFMGGEFGQRTEWSEAAGLVWDDAGDPAGIGVTRLLRDLNLRYRETPALWARDDDPSGTRWLASDRDANLLAFARFAPSEPGEPGEALVCVANFSGLEQRDYRIGLPWPGRWVEVLNTDSAEYGGWGTGNLGGVTAEEWAWGGEPASAAVTVGAGAVVWLASRA